MNYGLVDAGNNKVVAISIWETREEAQKSAAMAATWVKENIADRVRLADHPDRRPGPLPRRSRRRLAPSAKAALRGRSAYPPTLRTADHRPPRLVPGRSLLVPVGRFSKVRRDNGRR